MLDDNVQRVQERWTGSVALFFLALDRQHVYLSTVLSGTPRLILC